MIEIPESLIIASQLNDTVKGKRIQDVETERVKHAFAWYTGDNEMYRRIMIGKTIGQAQGIGSMVEIRLKDYCFAAGDGTNIRYYGPGVKLPERYQTRITLDDGSSLIFTVQMYGSMNLFIPEEYDNFYYHTAKEKPMPGTDDFDYFYFKELVEQAPDSLSIKAFLATEQRIPGLGNGCLQDILLACGLHPKHIIAAILKPQWKKVYESVLVTLQQMTAQGGRNTEKDLLGNPGGYRTKLSKKTLGEPCPYCGNPIQKMAYLGGTVYFCPECQI